MPHFTVVPVDDNSHSNYDSLEGINSVDYRDTGQDGYPGHADTVSSDGEFQTSRLLSVNHFYKTPMLCLFFKLQLSALFWQLGVSVWDYSNFPVKENIGFFWQLTFPSLSELVCWKEEWYFSARDIHINELPHHTWLGDKEKTIEVGEKRIGRRQGEQCGRNQTGLKCSHAKDGGPRVFLFPNAAKLVSLFSWQLYKLVSHPQSLNLQHFSAAFHLSSVFFSFMYL